MIPGGLVPCPLGCRSPAPLLQHQGVDHRPCGSQDHSGHNGVPDEGTPLTAAGPGVLLSPRPRLVALIVCRAPFRPTRGPTGHHRTSARSPDPRAPLIAVRPSEAAQGIDCVLRSFSPLGASFHPRPPSRPRARCATGRSLVAAPTKPRAATPRSAAPAWVGTPAGCGWDRQDPVRSVVTGEICRPSRSYAIMRPTSCPTRPRPKSLA
ncbi:hypothetical protein NDU88_010447 [Pleurodeles waltl]|uniref:Uncharacterized protein n=1 Tax=Pleurodeles waltl TaxID=8319 RepID=A0AAV7S1B6_PLEWA|nr:hypothetical protein NDU88_010447 [Pleurodeles waltl]